MKRVEVYTDGSATPDGRGGWAAILRYGRHERVLQGREEEGATNNRMELKAALEALRALQEPCEVHLYTDSEYLKRAFAEGWLSKWQKNGWRTASKAPVKNRDLWEALLKEASRHRVVFHWVRGHAGLKENERADRLAKGARAASPSGEDRVASPSGDDREGG
ncbi:MAG: ribonuclease HI [Thermus sp.]|uniref:ribonuclease HI n=1 Tax=Thermus sp. TaxID=275 RepID=UPI003324B29B